ncbi:MAG TPA: hypothetical protein ENI23_16640 [bacterium]|nr:hypothetical protein [bacterium]
MIKEAIEIIIDNLTLPAQNLPILEMVDKQEGLIERFIKLGYKKEQFFEISRKAIGIGDSHVVSSDYIERALNVAKEVRK